MTIKLFRSRREKIVMEIVSLVKRLFLGVPTTHVYLAFDMLILTNADKMSEAVMIPTKVSPRITGKQ